MSQDNQSEFLSRLLAGKPTDEDKSVIVERLSVLAADCILTRPSSHYLPVDRKMLVRAAQSAFSQRFDMFNLSASIEDRFSNAGALLSTHPELILPIGFDEVRYSPLRLVDPTLGDDVKGIIEEVAQEEFAQQELPSDAIPVGAIVARATHYRTPDGTWHDWEGVMDRLVPADSDDDSQSHRPFAYWYDRLVDTWLGCLNRGNSNSTQSITLPSFWMSPSSGDSLLHVAARSTLLELQRGSMSLEQLHWRTLEELVAELLGDLGLDVVVTPRSHDDGRDVIARGELIPGEPTLLAVEVKHRKVVPVSDLRAALWANRRFPALLFVTSGRFSAGVYREKSENESRLRLFLKDGAGLTQWINQYVGRSLRRRA